MDLYATVAQLVEYDLAKVGVAGSSPVSRSLFFEFMWLSGFPEAFLVLKTELPDEFTRQNTRVCLKIAFR